MWPSEHVVIPPVAPRGPADWLLRALAVVELTCCGLLTLMSVVEFKETFWPAADTIPLCTYAPIMGLVLFPPLALCFGLAGVTLYRRGRAWWLFQGGPLAVAVGITMLFM